MIYFDFMYGTLGYTVSFKVRDVREIGVVFYEGVSFGFGGWDGCGGVNGFMCDRGVVIKGFDGVP